MVQWLELRASAAWGLGSIPGQRTKTLQATRCGKKKKKNCSYLVTLVTFPVLSSYMWLVATVSDSAAIGPFHHQRNFHWTAPFSSSSTFQPEYTSFFLQLTQEAGTCSPTVCPQGGENEKYLGNSMRTTTKSGLWIELWVSRRGDPGGRGEKGELVRPAGRGQLAGGTRAGMCVP